MLANGAEVRDEYLRLRDVQRKLNTKLLRTISKKGFEQSARELGLWAGGEIVLTDESDMDLMSDYAIYEYRAGGSNAVERFLARGSAPEDSDEYSVLQAMTKARFTLVGIENIEPEVGVRAIDRIYGSPFLLADMGLSKTAHVSIVLATRLLSFPTFTMTSGASMTIDPELAALFVDGLREAFGQPSVVGMLPPKDRKQLARNLITLALEDPEEMKDAWRERLAEQRA